MVRISGMTVSWTPHRFQGGALALDAANTVVLRGDPERSFDRFADPAEIARFAEAAGTFRADELGGRRLAVADPHRIAPVVLAIREATDRLYRNAVKAGGAVAAADMEPFLRACADGLAGADAAFGAPGRPFGDADAPIALEAALAVSALSLLSGGSLSRLKLCRNCNWLFLDRSRNASRLWCDMAVCGNRQKASRHYRRRKAALEDEDA
jgi:predicted RNA-binding Zn ribbon-like protein